MHVYLVKSTSKLFKYNKTLRLNLFNKNITFINNYKFCKKETLLTENDTNLKEQNKEFDLDQIKDLSAEDLDKFLNSTNKDSENLQMRLYESNEIQTQETHELVSTKDQLPSDSDIQIDKGLSKQENILRLRKRLELANIEDYKVIRAKSKIGVSLFILLVGLFSLWIPLYKTICESQGFAVKTGHQDYSFQNKKCKK